MRHIYIVLFFIITSSCYVGDEVEPDQTIWEYEQPDNEGLSSFGLLNINDFIKLNQYLEINGLLIIRNDKIVFENYFKAGNYLQSKDEGAFATVKYYDLEVSH